MKALFLALTLVSGPLEKGVAISATESGVSGEDLADTPLSNAINMEAGQVTNQLSLTLAVTAGSSTRVVVRCYEAGTGEGYQQIVWCAGSACEPDVREFTLADFTAASGVIWITTRWPITKRFVKCSADDPDDGTGTVVMTGVRSWQ